MGLSLLESFGNYLAQEMLITKIKRLVMIEREVDMKVQCCVCGRIREGTKWRFETTFDAVCEDTSHGYCPVCAAKAFEDIRAFQRLKKLTHQHAMAST